MTDHEYTTAANVINWIVSVPSLIGCVYLIVSVQKTKHQTTGLKIVFWIGLGDLIYTVSNMMTWYSHDHDFACQVEGVLKELGAAISIYWVTMLSVFSYKSILSKRFVPFEFYKKGHFFAILAIAILVTM